MEKYDFSGWATRHGMKCSDGRTIMPGAFKDCDGLTVPLVWSHRHNDMEDVLGHALLECREEGVYTYASFNDTEQGVLAKALVKHGDIKSLSIYANQLKQDSSKRVMHGCIREVSLVHSGANPGAYIEEVLIHSDTGEFIREVEDEFIVHTGEEIELYHADNKEKENTTVAEETKKEEVKDEPVAENKDEKAAEGEETIADVINTMSEKQKNAMYAVIGQALEDAANENKENIQHSEGGNNSMKTNVFEQDAKMTEGVLSHADREAIVALAKQPGVASLKSAISIYAEENEALKHAFNQTDEETKTLLFPEPHLINPGAPEIIRDHDNSWVSKVINKIHKSPFSKIRTRKADARSADLKAKGYTDRSKEKAIMGQIKLLKRETSPQTVYVKDELHRDDIIDIDFDVVAYQWNVMQDTMNETLALAALVGDGRDESDNDKIHEANIRSIYNDDDFYCMHKDVDIAAAKAALQGTDTGANFGENYIYAEAIITAALYSREKFKGTGLPSLYCTPHLVNVMLLARDLNGRRIYDSKADLAKALNVAEIVEIEQLEGKTRTTAAGTKKLLGLFVNLADYTFGCAKGGQLTRFSDFDIDFNKYKYLMETRLSGSLTEPYSAIALEEPVVGE
jgi:HK97 family phage prohead protease